MAGLHDRNSIGPGEPPGNRGSLEPLLSDTKLPTGRSRRRSRGEPPASKLPPQTHDFQTVAVAGQDDVVALDIEDTLTLIEGLHVTLTTDAAARSVTVAVDAIPDTLDDLTDVDFTPAPSNGDRLEYDSATETWKPQAQPIPDMGLNDLNDVTVSSPTSGDRLEWTGTGWEPQPEPTTALDDLTDVDLTGTLTGDVLTKDGGGNWVPSTPTPVPSGLDDLSDVDLTGTSTGDVLTKDAGGDWVPAAPSGGATKLDDLSDVTIGTPAAGEVLKWTGALFEDQALNMEDLGDFDGTGLTTDDLIRWDGSNFVPDTVQLTEIEDVALSGSTAGQVLWYDGTRWVNNTLASGMSQLSDDSTPTLGGNLATGAYTVDGRDVSADGAALDDAVTLTGLPANSTHLGTFTGTTITDNTTVKGALQELETATEQLDTDKLDVTGGTITGQLAIDYDSTLNPALEITSTDVGADAAPIIDLVRDSASPASGDYLGQIKFKGENSTGGSQVYSKITGKIQDPTNGSEDGLIEFAAQTASTMTIMARLTGAGGSPALKLTNGTDLDLDSGDITLTGTVDGRDVSADGTEVDALVDVRDNGLFMCRKASLQTLTTSFADITSWATADVIDSDYSFNTTTGVLTINTTGVYEFSLQMTGAVTSSNRCEVNMKVLHDTGGGYSDLSTSAFAANYAARDTTHNQGDVSLPGYIVSLTSGDLLKVQMLYVTTAIRVRGYWSMKRLR